MNDIDLIALQVREKHEIQTTISAWLDAFETALANADRAALANLFIDDSHWRDVLAFTWHLTPRTGTDSIIDGLLSRQPAVRAHSFEIDQNRTMIVNFNAFNESSVDFFVYTFTKTTNWVHYHEVKQDVLLKISNIIEENNAEIAFPTTTMFLQQGNLDKPE